MIHGTPGHWSGQRLLHHRSTTSRSCRKSIAGGLFGTTFYSLVGLHATHVVVGLFLLSSTFLFSLFGWVDSRQSERFGVIAMYWHFVDAVWVVVFTVVYLIGR